MAEINNIDDSEKLPGVTPPAELPPDSVVPEIVKEDLPGFINQAQKYISSDYRSVGEQEEINKLEKPSLHTTTTDWPTTKALLKEFTEKLEAKISSGAIYANYLREFVDELKQITGIK